MSPAAIIRGGLLAALLLTGLSLGASAQGTADAPGQRQPSAAQAAQQERMRGCNAEAGTRSLAGDARKSFMSECLAGRMPPAPGHQPSAAQAAQQDRMRSCNAEAGTRKLAADARRSFMSECLAGRAAPAAR